MEKFNKPTKCIDPIIKCCQHCKYGTVIYPDIIEKTSDVEGCCFKTKCIYNLENTKPTSKEIEEFNKFYKLKWD